MAGLVRIALAVAVIIAAAGGLQAQRVFKASELDARQDVRIGALESRVDAVERSMARMAPMLSDSGVGEPASVGADPDGAKRPPSPALSPGAAKLAAAPSPTPEPPGPRWKTTAELKAEIAAHLPEHVDSRGRFRPKYATMGKASDVYVHLVSNDPHSFTASQVNGLSLLEAMVLHDLAPEHGGKIYPRTRGPAPRQAEPVLVSEQGEHFARRKVLQPVEAVQSAQPGCAGGQCPAGSSTIRSTGTVRVRSRLFPRLFGR